MLMHKSVQDIIFYFVYKVCWLAPCKHVVMLCPQSGVATSALSKHLPAARIMPRRVLAF